MGLEGDRGRRAGNYILGLMAEAERERAERDLEFDPAFRDAVIRLAEEMHLFDRAEIGGDAGERWKLVARRIAELPQMRQADLGHAREAKSFAAAFKRRVIGKGLHAMPGRRAVFIALGLIAAFVSGYVVGRL